MSEAKSKVMCSGCYNNVYNHGTGGAKECWSFKDAEVVTRWRIGTWTMPATPRAFTEVCVLNCYHHSGASYVKELPDFAVSPVRLKEPTR